MSWTWQDPGVNNRALQQASHLAVKRQTRLLHLTCAHNDMINSVNKGETGGVPLLCSPNTSQQRLWPPMWHSSLDSVTDGSNSEEGTFRNEGSVELHGGIHSGFREGASRKWNDAMWPPPISTMTSTHSFFIDTAVA